MDIYNKLECAYKSIRKKTGFVPEVGLTLGSGLGNYAKNIKVEEVIPYDEIENFPRSTVEGHQGKFIFGYVKDIPVLAMQGRVHYYEGYKMSDVVMPTRIMGMLGAKTIILTNAAGGINEELAEGKLMLLTDHISSFVPSPLIGANIDKLGTRFPDMTKVYDEKLRKLAKEKAQELGIDLKEGVYLQLTGPNYETPAEVRMCKDLGASAVGMSTACEAMAAKHMGMSVLGISCITNMAAGLSNKKLEHKEVQEVADRVAADFERLITNIISGI